MPRIRTIKPDFFRSRTLNEVSVSAQRTFIGLWCMADDDGRYRYEPALLRADVWPLAEDVTAKQVDGWIDELEQGGVVCRYESAGKTYLHVVNWHEHQRINRPTPSPLPECSRSAHGTRREPSPLEVEREEEEEEESTPLSVVPTDAAVNDAIRQVWETYLDACQRVGVSVNARLTPKRRDKIRTRLKAAPLQDVLDAAEGWTLDPWPERRLHCDAAQIFKSDEQVEKFRDLWRDGPPAVMGKNTTQTVAFARQMAAMRPAKEVTADDVGRVDGDRALAQRQLSRPEG